jgi:hypothetical protein
VQTIPDNSFARYHTAMQTASFLLFRHDTRSLVFDFAYSAVIFTLIFGMVLWDRRYGRKWQQFRARNWRQVTGKLDEGDIVPLLKGRSRTISGYQIWFGYDYEVDGEQVGIYTLPFFSEFRTKEEAEVFRKLAADQSVIVRVSPRNPKRSCILDEDVRPLIESADGTSARQYLR